MNIAKKLFLLFPAFLLFSLGAEGQTLNANFTIDVSKKCRDSTFTFNANTTTYTGSNPLTYSWFFGDLSIGTNNVSQTKTYSSAGKYTVKLIVTDGTLIDSIKKDVEAYPVPVANFTMGNDFCQFTEFPFYNTSTVSSGYIASYLWTFDVGKTSTAKDPTYLFSDAKSYNIKLEVWTDKGCYATISKPLTILARPSASFTYTPVCAGFPTTITSTSKGTVTSYKWVFPNNVTATGPQTTQLLPAGNNLVKLITYNANTGCHDSIISSVTVNNAPKPNFVVKNTCQDSVLYIVNQTKPEFGEITEYVIDWDGLNTLDQTTRLKVSQMKSDTIYHVYTPNPLKEYRIDITVKTIDGCESVGSFKTTVRGKPKAGFTVKNTCLDSAVQFTDTSKVPPASGGFVKFWYWNFGDSTAGVPNTSNLQNPAHKYTKPGTYKVKLIAATDAGCSDSVTKTVIVYPSPNAFFTFFTDCKRKPILFKDTSTITGTGSVVRWEWNFGDPASGVNNTSSLKSPTHSFTAAGKYVVKLRAFSNLGCAGEFSDTVNIHPDATPAFTWTGSCERGNIVFSDKSTPPPGRAIINYEWNFGDGNVNKTNSKVVSHAFQTPGLKKVTLKVTTSDGCPDSIINDEIMVLPAPKASFTNTPTCIGREVDFTNTTTISGSLGLTYKWTFGDPTSGPNNTATTKDAKHTFINKGIYDVKLVVYSSNGCKDSIIKKVEAAYVPQSAFIAVPICNDSVVVFTDNSTVQESVISERRWYWGDGTPPLTGNNKNPSHKYAAAGTYVVSLVTVSASGGGCKDSVPMTITTYPSPITGFTYQSHCADTAIQFVNTSAMPGGSGTIAAYEWNFGDGNISSETNPSHKFESGGEYNVTLTAISNRGCRNVIQQKVKVLERPMPAYSPFGSCAKGPITFFDDNPNGGIISKVWDFGDGGTSTDNEPTHVFQAAGTYNISLTVKNANGCDSTLVKEFVVSPLPNVNFGWVGGCAGEPVVFRDSSTTASGRFKPKSIRFGDFGGFIGFGDKKTRTYTYSTPGVYLVSLAIADADDGCWDTLTQEITIYPKPTPTFSADIVCQGEETTLVGKSDTAGGAIATWEWQFEDGTKKTTTTNILTHTFKKDGVNAINLTVTNTAGCNNSVSGTVNVLEKPEASFRMNNPVTIVKPEVKFENTSNDFTGYSWDFGDGFVNNTSNTPTHKYRDTGKYPVTLIIENAAGCRDTMIDTVHVKQGYVIHIPNVVTPNNDGVNDKWKPLGEGIEDYELVIMNRWGGIVFQTYDFEEWWNCDKNYDGITVPEGVYMYFIRIIDFEVDEVDVRKGFINVIR